MTIKRISINAALLLLLVLTIVWCFKTGKAYNVILENIPTSVEGLEYQPIEAAYINFGKDPILMLEGDVIVERVVGKELTLQIDVVDDDDKVLESRVASFTLDELGDDLRMSIPVFYARAEKK